MGRGLLQLQLDLRTPETLLRRSSCSREEAELQEGAAAASTLHLAPAASCSPGGGVRGGTAWPDPLHHHWSAIFKTHLRSLCPPSQGSKVSESFSVWSWGCCRVRVAAGRGSLQAGRRRRLYISVLHLDHQLLWIGIPPHPFEAKSIPFCGYGS